MLVSLVSVKLFNVIQQAHQSSARAAADAAAVGILGRLHSLKYKPTHRDDKKVEGNGHMDTWTHGHKDRFLEKI
jgi:hypothetical protein